LEIRIVGNKCWSVLFGVVMLACFVGFAISPFVGWWMPQGLSTHAADVDFLFYVILYITTFFFILTEALIVVFMWCYASKGDMKHPVSEQADYPSYLKPLTNLLYDQHRVEMAWTFVPAVILLYIAFAQVGTWANVKYQSRIRSQEQANAAQALQIGVSARQFEWRMRYPSVERFKEWVVYENTQEDYTRWLTARNATEEHHKKSVADKTVTNKDYEKWLTDIRATKSDYQVLLANKKLDHASFGKIPQADDVYVVNELHIWQDHQVMVHLSTRDVIHSFNLPHFRVKQDALPGKIIPVWFTPTKSNTVRVKGAAIWHDGLGRDDEGQPKDRTRVWDIPCAELCGWGHWRMVGRVYVHPTQEDFLAWLDHAGKSEHGKAVMK
jgi:heme/copper-type cytochrome/quinol oxidase subunit 2